MADTLSDAAAKGDLQAVRALLDSGVPADSRSADGRTPLICAAMASHLGVVSALLEAGADVGARSVDGSTALTTAALWNQPDVVRRLLAHGADPDAADGSGWTPSDIARTRGYTAIAELLGHRQPDIKKENV